MYSILVVDDQESTANYIKAVLQTRGMAATVCGGAEAALELFKTHRYDLVLTDLRMQPVDGLGLVRGLREMGSQVPVVVMTGYETLASAGESLRLGVFDYVTKPLDVKELMKTVTHAIAMGQAMGGSVDVALLVPAHQVCDGLVAVSGVMCRAIEALVRVSETDSPVVFVGEKGVGRQLAAQVVHNRSRRRGTSFVTVSEQTLLAPDTGGLMAAIKGAGSVFIDELTCLSMPAQEALIRALCGKTGEAQAEAGDPKKGPDVAQESDRGNATVPPRLLASSVSDLADCRTAGVIHSKLAERLSGVAVKLPPLRERKEDIIPLLYRLLQREKVGTGTMPRVELKVFDLFERYAWPGNVGELEDAVKCMVRGEKDGCIGVESLPAAIREGGGSEQVEFRHDLDAEFMRGEALRRFLQVAGKKELFTRMDQHSPGKTDAE